MRCVVADAECVQGRLRQGMCERHYRRQLRTGTTASPRIDSFSRFTVTADGCHEWSGPLWRNGYGKLSREEHGTRLAHRAFYIEALGPIPDGLDLDHLCRNRKCVRPDHLEPVSRAVNLSRGHESRKRCEKGLHDISAPEALRPGTKQCVLCWRERYRAAGARYRAKLRAAQCS
jgi:hypothetical protein